MHGFGHVYSTETAVLHYIIKNTISFLPSRHNMNETRLFSILDSVDSTNNYAMGQVHAGLAKHGQCWFARQQTSGKGQRGKKWETGRDQNIALTIGIKLSGLKISEQFNLSVAVALGCHDFFYRFAGDGTSIKWPNDIYWGDRKAGGILIENIIQGNNWKYALIGIGINLNQSVFPSAISAPVSLAQITGKNYDPVLLGRVLHETVMARIEKLNPKSFAVNLDEYNMHLYKRHKIVKLRSGDTLNNAEIMGVTSEGKLEIAGGKTFNFGEVEWIKDT